MNTTKLAYRQKTHLNRYDIKVALVSLDAVIRAKDGSYQLDDGKVLEEVDSLTSIRGDANSKARMKKMATKHGAVLLEDVDALDTMIGSKEERKPSKHTPPKPTGEVKGWLLEAFKPSWGMVDGKERWYRVGKTPNEKRLRAVESDWVEAGYVCRTKPLRPRIHEVVDDLWDVPSEPIVSRVPGDPWVGDHLGPHLRALGLTIQQYRDTFNYTGPAMVNRAAKSLDKAHKRIRRSSVISGGRFVAEVKGDRHVTVWQIRSVGEDEVILDSVAGTDHEKDRHKTVSRRELVHGFKMIEPWPQTTKDRES